MTVKRQNNKSFTMSEVIDYVESIFRRPWYVLIPFLSVLTLVAVFVFMIPDKYKSYTLIMVESEKVPDSFVTKTAPSASQRIATIKQEILSRTRLERVVEELNPYPEDMGRIPLTNIVEQMRQFIFIRVRGNDAFTIEYVHYDPEMAMKVTNRLASLFIEETTKDREQQVEETHEFIDSQLQEANKKLMEMEREISAYKQRYMGALPQQLGANLSTLQGLQLELQTINQSLQAAESRKIILEQNLTGALRQGQLVALDTSATGNTLNTELSQARAEHEELRKRYTAEHPDVQRVRARVTRLEKQLSELTRVTVQSMSETGQTYVEGPEVVALRSQLREVTVEIEGLKSKRASTEERIGLYERRVQETPEVEEALLARTRDYDQLQENYLTLLNTKLEAQTAEALEKRWKGDIFKVLDPAYQPERPYYPNRPLYMFAGAILGLFAGIFTALTMEFLDPSVKSPHQLQSLVPYQVLVTIPRMPIDVGTDAGAADGNGSQPGHDGILGL